MDVLVRACAIQDFQAVLGLLAQLWPELKLDANATHNVYAQALSSPIQKLIVATMDDHIVGFCSLTIKNNLWQGGYLGNVDELVVDSKYRRHGIGEKLMNAITQVAIANNCKRLELDSSFHRHEAHKFYERIGFKSRAYLYTKLL